MCGYCYFDGLDPRGTKICDRQCTVPANLGFRGISNFLILIKSILDWLYENQNIKKLDCGNVPKMGVIVSRDFCPINR